MRTDMDYLVIGDFLFVKSEQPEWKEESDWREKYALD
jgi:carbamoyltransferase